MSLCAYPFKLLEMHRRELLDGLQFHDHALINEQIDPQALVVEHAVVLERDSTVPLNMQSAPDQGTCEHGFIHRLQQPRAKIAMDLQRRIDDDLGTPEPYRQSGTLAGHYTDELTQRAQLRWWAEHLSHA